jgi:hypothetical protein
MSVVRWPISLLAFALLFLIVAPGIAGQVVGESWTSPTYGFNVSWAGTTWQPTPEGTLTAVGPERLDRLHLVNGTSSLYFEGATRYQGDLSSCVGAEANLLAQETGVSGIRPYRDPRGVPLAASGPDVEAAAFTLTLMAGMEELELVDYVECRVLVPGEAVLIVTLVTEPSGFPDELASARTVIDSISFESDRPVDPLLAYGGWIEAAQRRPSVAGPLSGELEFGPDTLAVARAGVDAPDLYARAEFAVPAPEIDSWDIGLGFRDSGEEEQLRLVIDSAGNWFFKDGLGDVIAGGAVDDVDASPAGSNVIEIVAVGDVGYFAFNERLVGELDLSTRAAGGDVFVGAGFFREDAEEASATSYRDFQVWSLSGLEEDGSGIPTIVFDPATIGEIVAASSTGAPLAGPAAGDLAQAVGAAAVAAAGVEVEDFVASATFFNPGDAAAQPWDFGIAFRAQENGDHYRLTIASDGTWEYQIGLQTNLAGGSVPSMSFEEGAANTLEIVVAGNAAAFSLNGAFVSALDASQLRGASDVWVGSGFHLADAVAGAITRFADFTVWPVDVSQLTPDVGQPSAPPTVSGELRPGQIAVELQERDGSGVDGLAVLVESEDATTVSVVTRGASGDEVVVVHRGSCEAISALPAFLLADVDDAGSSETNLAAPLGELTDGTHSIAIHRSSAEYETVVACGDVPAGG